MNTIHYSRYLKDQINSWLFTGKVLIVYGARQVGKTTLVKEILKEYPGSVYLNCETNQVNELLESRNVERIRTYLGSSTLVIFDEAQKIRNIGLLLKIIHDAWPEIQIIATGSISFNLLNEISEPITGRNVKFLLYPLSYAEIGKEHHVSILDDRLELFMRFGMYPDIVDRPESQKIKLLDELASDYLFRDVLKFDNLKRPDVLNRLIKALALQIGNEVSFTELSKLLKVSVETIQRYIEILEKSFIIFRLGSFSRNLSKELARSQKFYFYDLGLRNSMVQNFSVFQNRSDIGSLWENFCIVERLKANQLNNRIVNQYFWRTYDQKEIDLIEETGGRLFAFEFKVSAPAKFKKPGEFLSSYPGSEFNIIHRENCYSFFE